MKKISGLVIVCIVIASGIKAQTIKIFYEKRDRDYVFYADNNELYPISVSLDFDLTNLKFSEDASRIFIIPASRSRFKLGELTTLSNGATRFSYKYKTTLGDVTISRYDKDYVYDLPFQKGKSFRLFQGYNGSFSHQQENALDFTMPEGTEILAAREGIVVQLVQNNSESCPREECKKYNNYITIMHPDGTFSYYAHFKYNGAKVKLGDAVKKGDVIAYSGNVGWSSGPHLHFACFLPQFEKRRYIETKFKTDEGDKTEMLKEGNVYVRNY
ncbi:MAG: M23 family metallopeptidase [Chitinophagaceae bacterium]